MIELAPPLVSVPVLGGDLAVGVWNGADASAPTVLAIHGITASHRCWPLVTAALPGVRVIAPDLRGRGRSNALGAPYGLAQHARDMVAMLDYFGVDRVAVLAHSMGAFVAVTLAAAHPDRVASLTLVDGGLPLDPPAASTSVTTSGETAVLGPAAARLSMTFRDREAYRDFWRHHPAFRADWNDAVQGYVDYDLQGIAPALQPSGIIDAVSTDVAQLYGGDAYASALAAIRVPTTFLRAPRGLLDEPQALYRAGRATEHPTIDAMRVVEVADVNHYTIVLARSGAETVAREVRRALDADTHGVERVGADAAEPVSERGIA